MSDAEPPSQEGYLRVSVQRDHRDRTALDQFFRACKATGDAAWALAIAAIVSGTGWIILYCWIYVQRLPRIDIASAAAVVIGVGIVGVFWLFLFTSLVVAPGLMLRSLYGYPTDLPEARRKSVKRFWNRKSATDAIAFLCGVTTTITLLLYLSPNGRVQYPSLMGVAIFAGFNWARLRPAFALPTALFSIFLVAALGIEAWLVDLSLPSFKLGWTAQAAFFGTFGILTFITIALQMRRRWKAVLRRWFRAPSKKALAATSRFGAGLAVKSMASILTVLSFIPILLIAQHIDVGAVPSQLVQTIYSLAFPIELFMVATTIFAIAEWKTIPVFLIPMLAVMFLLLFQLLEPLPLQILGLGQTWDRVDLSIPDDRNEMIDRCLLHLRPSAHGDRSRYEDIQVFVVNSIGNDWVVSDAPYPPWARSATPAPGPSGVSTKTSRATPQPSPTPCVMSMPATWVQTYQRDLGPSPSPTTGPKRPTATPRRLR